MRETRTCGSEGGEAREGLSYLYRINWSIAYQPAGHGAEGQHAWKVPPIEDLKWWKN